jgi:hypothetical protein
MACDEHGNEVCVMRGGPWDSSEIRLPALLKRLVARDGGGWVDLKLVYRRTPHYDDRDRAIWDFAGTIRPLR